MGYSFVATWSPYREKCFFIVWNLSQQLYQPHIWLIPYRNSHKSLKMNTLFSYPMVAPSLIRKIIVWSLTFTELKQNYTFPELVQNRLQFELNLDTKVPLTRNRVHTDLSLNQCYLSCTMYCTSHSQSLCRYLRIQRCYKIDYSLV